MDTSTATIAEIRAYATLAALADRDATTLLSNPDMHGGHPDAAQALHLREARDYAVGHIYTLLPRDAGQVATILTSLTPAQQQQVHAAQDLALAVEVGE